MRNCFVLRYLITPLVAILVSVVALCSPAQSSVSLTDPIILEPSNLDTQDLFGADIAIDEDTLVIISKRYLYFYEFDDNDNLNYLFSIAASRSDRIQEVELVGGVLVVALDSIGPGIIGYNGKPSRTEVYTRDTTGNWQLEIDTLPSATYLSFDGSRLILSEQIFPVTAGGSRTSVYRRSATGQWVSELELPGVAGRVDIEGDLAVIGAPGGVQLYSRAGGEWSREVSASLDELACNWCPVSLHDKSLLLGVTGQGADNGSAYLYTQDGSGNWLLDHVFNGRVDASPGQENYIGVIGDKFGNGVELFENKALIAAFDGNFSQLSGLLYVFEKESAGVWAESYVLLSAYAYDGYPAGIAASDSYVVGGGLYTGAESGVAYAFKLDGATDADRLCIDNDGDGWGWDGIKSCVVTSQAGECDYSDASLYHGWGWNPVTSESCPPLEEQGSNCIDTDGDGWGWDGVQTCVIGGSGCDYSDADSYNGWGWNPGTLESCPPLN